MVLLGEHAAEVDQARFTGRRTELAALAHVLSLASPVRVVLLVGPGGIGKSALLRELARCAEADGVRVLWDTGGGADVPHRHARPAAPRGGRTLLLLDTSVGDHVLEHEWRESVIPRLPADTVVVIASRQPPGREWSEGAWSSVVTRMDLPPLSDAESAALLRAWGLRDPSRIRAALQHCHGLPLALVLAAEHDGVVEPAVLVGRMLGHDADLDTLRILGVAAMTRSTTPVLLAAAEVADPEAAYHWLATRSFVNPTFDGLALHPVVAEAVVAMLRDRDPVGEGIMRSRIADHLHARILTGESRALEDLHHLVLDPAFGHGVGEVPADVIGLLRMLRVPRLLDAGPAWLGNTPMERREALHALLESVLRTFGSSTDDQLAVRIIREAYLEGLSPHEVIARRLHLSRSAYFRRLGAALGRVGAQLAVDGGSTKWDGSGTD